MRSRGPIKTRQRGHETSVGDVTRPHPRPVPVQPSPGEGTVPRSASSPTSAARTNRRHHRKAQPAQARSLRGFSHSLRSSWAPSMHTHTTRSPEGLTSPNAETFHHHHRTTQPKHTPTNTTQPQPAPPPHTHSPCANPDANRAPARAAAPTPNAPALPRGETFVCAVLDRWWEGVELDRAFTRVRWRRPPHPPAHPQGVPHPHLQCMVSRLSCWFSEWPG